MITLIDNYDSFTYNLYHYLGELGSEISVHRNDKITVSEVIDSEPEAIVISPGPGTPDDAGICLDLVRACSGDIPIFGVCLGHQTIAQVFGGEIISAPTLMHGKVSTISNMGGPIMQGLDETFKATRYHSLTVNPHKVPNCFAVTARDENGVIMGISHKDHPTHGVQFHPESIASENGHKMLQNFLDDARKWRKAA